MDTMTLTKIIGGFCGAFLVFLLGGWAAETIYHSGAGGHGDDHAQAYSIPVEGDDHGGGEEEPEVPFAEILAAADPADGEGAFRACQSCHKVAEGENGAGPSLYGIVGRPAGSIAGFNYSGALTEVVDVWTPEALNEFLAAPRSYAPGTSMSYNGMRDVEDRAALITWLDSIDG